MELPLPVPLLLKYDISEAAGAPNEVGKKWKPVGSQGRGDRQETEGTGEGDMGVGGKQKEIKKAP